MAMIDWEDRDDSGRDAFLEHLSGRSATRRPDWVAILTCAVMILIQVSMRLW